MSVSSSFDCIGGNAYYYTAYNASNNTQYTAMMCDCYAFYNGNDCSGRYKDVSPFLPISLVISAVHFALLLYLAWIALLECCSRAWKTKQTTRSLVAVTAFGRLLMLLLSPSYGILSPAPKAPLDALLLFWPFVFVLLAALNSILHWNELTRQSLPVRKNAARQSMDSVRSPSASTRGGNVVTSPSPNGTATGTGTMASTSNGSNNHKRTYTMVIVSTNAASLLKYVTPRVTRGRATCWTIGFVVLTIASWVPAVSDTFVLIMRIYICVWFAEVSTSFAFIINKMAKVAAEIRASHQYHRRSLQKAIRLAFIFMLVSVVYIAATIIEIAANVGPWVWLAMVTLQRTIELILLTVFIWALETDSSYAPRSERQKIRGPIGRDIPDAPAERDLYKDREINGGTTAIPTTGGGGHEMQQRDRDREAARAYNDRYKSSGVVNSGPMTSEPGTVTNTAHGNGGGAQPHRHGGGGHGHANGNGGHRPTGNTFVTGGHSLAISVNQEWVPHPSLASPGGSGLYDGRSHMFRAPNVKGGGATQLNNELHDSGLLTTANGHAGLLPVGGDPSSSSALDATNTHMSSVENATTTTMHARSATYTMTITAVHPYAVPDAASSLLQVPSSAM